MFATLLILALLIELLLQLPEAIVLVVHEHVVVDEVASDFAIDETMGLALLFHLVDPLLL